MELAIGLHSMGRSHDTPKAACGRRPVVPGDAGVVVSSAESLVGWQRREPTLNGGR